MPQREFLDFLAQQARRHRGFELRMQAEALGLIEEGGRIAGVRAKTPQGPLAVRADLVVAADGRHSTLRGAAGLHSDVLGAPMDVLWLRLPRRGDDPAATFGHAEAGRLFVMLNRGDYWQCAYVIPKGGFDEVRAAGLPALRQALVELSPFLADRVERLRDWDDVKLLTVAVDRLRTWHRPGLLCIGDAAHAMSPIGGVGINLAIQDAVAAANRLAPALRSGKVSEDDLAAVQRRREWPTRMTQAMQVAIQNRVIRRLLASRARLRAPLALRLLRWFPVLRRVPARLIGIGFRREQLDQRL